MSIQLRQGETMLLNTMNSNSIGTDRLSVRELRDSREAWWTEQFTEFVWSHIKDDVGRRVLELGAGTGVLAQRLRGRLDRSSMLVGVDLEPDRAKVAAQAVLLNESHPISTYCVAGGHKLPFADSIFCLSISILTLQHINTPDSVLAEIKRVAKPSSAVVCIEADNVAQKIYLPRPQADLDDAIIAFWREIRNRYLPADIAVGPYVAGLYNEVGLGSVTC